MALARGASLDRTKQRRAALPSLARSCCPLFSLAPLLFSLLLLQLQQVSLRKALPAPGGLQKLAGDALLRLPPPPLLRL